MEQPLHGAAIAWSSHCMEQTLAGGSHHCMEQTLAGGSHEPAAFPSLWGMK